MKRMCPRTRARPDVAYFYLPWSHVRSHVEPWGAKLLAFLAYFPPAAAGRVTAKDVSGRSYHSIQPVNQRTDLRYMPISASRLSCAIALIALAACCLTSLRSSGVRSTGALREAYRTPRRPALLAVKPAAAAGSAH